MLHNTLGRYNNYLFLGFSSDRDLVEKTWKKKTVLHLGLIAMYTLIGTCSSCDTGLWILHLRPHSEEVIFGRWISQL